MPKVRVIFLLGVFSTLFLPAGASAQQNSMQLLAPDVGWALVGDRLFWTTDGGSGWRDITPAMTPAMPSQEHVAAVFFLDTSSGWVVLSAWDQAADKVRFDLASTGDGGTTWSVAPLNLPDLGPRFPPLGGGARIDFVDSLHAWINFDGTSSSNFRLGGLAMTTDGGRIWDWAPRSPGVAGSIRFVTTEDGWLAGGPGNTGLYVTHDGSKSWQQLSLKPPPQAGPAIYPTYEVPIFRDSRHGFLPVNYSGPEGTPSKLVLFATDDGGKTWKPDRVLPHLRETSIGNRPLVAVVDSALITAAVSNRTRLTLTTVTPTGETTASADIACLGPPIVELSFVDSNRGWVRPCQLLSTTDGGNTWTDITPGRPRKTHAPCNARPLITGSVSEATGSPPTSLTGVGVNLATAPQVLNNIARQDKKVTIELIQNRVGEQFGLREQDLKVRSNPKAIAFPGQIAMNLVKQLTSASLPEIGRRFGGKHHTTAVPSFASEATASGGGGGGGSVHTSVHLGFDRSLVRPISDMQTWWTSSPYFDTSVYLPGAASHGVDSNLNATWVTQITNQGWGLMPLWSGPQAPCACYGLSPPCIPFPHTFSSSPSVAGPQGKTEADSAASAASALGLSRTIIYYDMEQYSSTQCGSAVTAFVAGWVSELHNKGYSAGVYGSPLNANADWSQASPLPDDVWIAKWDSRPRATTLGLDPLPNGPLWANNQRIHQYIGQITEMYGGIQFDIDRDIEDALVAGGNGAKSYTYTLTTLNYPGAFESAAQGINDTRQGQTQGSLGQIVGWYFPGPPNNYGYLDDAGVFTTIAYPGMPVNFAFGVNNIGQIVGAYAPDSLTAHQHGFLDDNGTFTSIDYPGAAYTVARGINDASQIVGYYVDASKNTHGFLDDHGTFTSIDFPRATDTYTYGISGAGQIVGVYYDSRGGAAHFFTTTAASHPSTARARLRPWSSASTITNRSWAHAAAPMVLSMTTTTTASHS